MNVKNAVIGFATAGAANAVWNAFPAITSKIEQGPLSFVEHYNVGMALIALQSKAKKYPSLLDGASTYLICSELFQDHPFAVGKPTFTASLLVSAFLSIAIAATR